MCNQALAREIGSRGITVNNVQPGPIDTELNPAAGDWAVPQKAATALNRYGRVDEIAAMVASLPVRSRRTSPGRILPCTTAWSPGGGDGLSAWRYRGLQVP